MASNTRVGIPGGRFGVPAWIGLVIGGFSLLLVVAIIVSICFGNWVLAGAVGAIGYAPLLLSLLLALLMVAGSIDRRPILPPASVLAHWVRGLSRASSATFGLAIGALVGAIAGTSVGLSDSSRALSMLMSFLVAVVGVGLLGAVSAWAILGVVDIARISVTERELAVYRTLRGKTRHARWLADAAASLASPSAVLMAGAGLALLILTACNMVLATL